MSDTYVLVSRSLLEKSFYNDSKAVHLLLHLHFRMRHKENVFRLENGEIVTVAPGQVVVSKRQIEKETGIDKSTAYRILDRLESENEVSQVKRSEYRLITVKNRVVKKNSEPPLSRGYEPGV